MITRSITRPVASPIARAVTAAYGAWNPRALFANGEQGVWYDPNDLSTLFQDAAGTTPLTAAGQPVGLMLDKRLGLVRGPEKWDDQLVAFSGAAIRVSPGVYRIYSAGGEFSAAQIVGAVVGRTYEISYTVDSVTIAGSGVTTSGTAQEVYVTTLGVKTYRITANSTSIGIKRAASACDIQVSNISIRELPGNHATQPTAASRPMLRQNATTGAYYLETDGSDDWMSTSAIDFTGTDKVSVFAGLRKLSDATIGILAELSASSSANAGAFGLFAPGNAGQARLDFLSRGTSTGTASYVNAAIAAPVSVVAAGIANVAAPSSALRVNGQQAAQTSVTQGAGNYGNHPLYLFRRAGTTLPFNGHFYGLTIVGRLTTDAETRNVERLYANKTGVTLA